MKEALNGNETIKSIISKCKNLVAYFKHRGLVTTKLKNYQEQMSLPLLKVKQAVDTRWNSVLSTKAIRNKRYILFNSDEFSFAVSPRFVTCF